MKYTIFGGLILGSLLGGVLFGVAPCLILWTIAMTYMVCVEICDKQREKHEQAWRKMYPPYRY